MYNGGRAITEKARTKNAVSVVVPGAILDVARMNVDDANLELAAALCAQRRPSLGKARALAGMSLWQARAVLASRRIAVHLEPQDGDHDVETLRCLGRL